MYYVDESPHNDMSVHVCVREREGGEGGEQMHCL